MATTSAVGQGTGSINVNIEKTNGPNGTIIGDFLKYTDKTCDLVYVAGDKFSMSGLKRKAGFTLIEAVAEEMPPYGNRDEEMYQDFDTQIRVTVHADSNKHQANQSLTQNIANWLIGDRKDYMKVLDKELVSSQQGNHVIKLTLLADNYMIDGLLGTVISSTFFDEVSNKHMNHLIKEGVCYVKGKVSEGLESSLRRNIDDLARKTQIDYHPNSKDIVRDLVHPALYPYIKNVSKLKGSEKSDAEPADDSQGKDFWNRKYESSRFQWLPTPFKITEDGKCLIQEYINNLDRNIFPDLYTDLQSLFEIFIPYFEEVWSYAKAMEFFQSDEDGDDEVDEIPPLDKKPVFFKGQELQIIAKIVEYTLKAGQSFEGVWHAEGMSHENIVMTGIYFLDRDENISGGHLRFKRAFTITERNKVLYNVPQCRPVVVNNFADEGFIPLGYFPTEQGYLLVFPNCHIHKLTKLINNSSKESASRRIVVFFFVNPEKKIISTRDVAPQQNSISLTAAKNYRLELMAERKYDKEKLNVRNIELCEH